MAEPSAEVPTESQGGTQVPKPSETQPDIIDMKLNPATGQYEVTDETPPGTSTAATATGGEQQGADTGPVEDPYQQFDKKANAAWEAYQQTGRFAPEAPVEPVKVLPVLETDKPETPPPGLSPKQRWESHEQRSLKLEEQKNLVLLELERDGMRLADIVYTPEGQREIADTREKLVKIVEAASVKPDEEKVGPGFDRSRAAIAEVEQKNKEMLEAWEVSKKARLDALLRGDKMSNTEVEVYLTQILNQGPLSTTDYEGNKQKDALVSQFAKKRLDIANALMYQSGEKGSVVQSYLVLKERRLRYYEIKILQAQEAFAKGWEEVEKRSEAAKAA